LSYRKFTLLTLLVIFLNACGFKPLYNYESLDGFIVNTPENKTENSMIIYEGLRRSLNVSTTKKNYIIDFYVNEQSEDIDIREDEKVLRKNLAISVVFTIKEKNSEKEIFSGESLISSAYNRVAEPYSNYISEQDTRSRILESVVGDIKRQLALFKSNRIN
tara:strand:- start:189 stop:671 length:483 start_codon:yes stop_codon:yes gene_type:complete